MSPQQRHIIEKMRTVHNVRIYGEASRGALIVFSHVERRKQYLSFKVGYNGSVDLLSIIKATPKVNQEFKRMVV
jgi:hypothetical protein